MKLMQMTLVFLMALPLTYYVRENKKKLTLNMENVDSKLRDIGSESFAAIAGTCLLG